MSWDFDEEEQEGGGIIILRIILATVLDRVSIGWDCGFNEKKIIIDSQNVRAVRYLRSHFTIKKLRCRKIANLLHSHPGDK